MRGLKKNRQTAWYATYKSKAAAKDDYGQETGEYVITYNTPVKVSWNIRFADSAAEVEMFGVESRNVLAIVADKPGFPLTDSSIIWYGKSPHAPFAATAPDHNYIVAGIRPSLNGVVFYAKKINTFSEQPT